MTSETVSLVNRPTAMMIAAELAPTIPQARYILREGIETDRSAGSFTGIRLSLSSPTNEQEKAVRRVMADAIEDFFLRSLMYDENLPKK